MSKMKFVLRLLEVEPFEKFKIKKDETVFNSTFFFDENYNLYQCEENVKYIREDLVIKLLQGKYLIVKDKYVPFKPTNGDTYFFYKSRSHGFAEDIWKSTVTDYINYASGNCFRTRTEAQKQYTDFVANLRSIYEGKKEKSSLESDDKTE